MTIASVLTALNGDESSAATLRAALTVGRAFDAYVEVLHVQLEPERALPIIGEGMSAVTIDSILDSARQSAEARAEKAQSLFQEAAAELALPLTTSDADAEPGRFAVAWTQTTGDEPREVAERSRLFDLTVLARPNQDENFGAWAVMEEALFHSGRPVLVAPPEPPKSVGRSMVFAWSDTREFARSLWAALPLLKQAEKVVVVSVGDKEDELRPARLVRALSRHGVVAETKLPSAKGRDVGETLLATAAELEADLLVMGAYGHSRLREFALGGVTRHVLENAQLPVLMCH